MYKSPAFQFYPSEFISDENVVLMNNQEVGCYTKLICFCWIQGSIPVEVEKIARLCGENGEAMAELWQNIKVCFKAKGDRLIHPRLERERVKQEAYRQERSESGKKGAEKRWKNKGLDSEAIAEPTVEPMAEPMAKNSSLSLSPSLSLTNKEQPAHPSRHFANKIEEKYVDEINKHCKTLKRFSDLSQNGLKFNGHQWVQKMTNEDIHPLAIIDGLKATIKKWHDQDDPLDNPYTYANSVVKTKSGNYREAKFIKESQDFKKIWAEMGSALKGLASGIGKEIE